MFGSLPAAVLASPAVTYPAQPITARDSKCPDARWTSTPPGRTGPVLGASTASRPP